MNKFARGCLITALSLLATGIIIVIVCIIIGGTTLFHFIREEATSFEVLNPFRHNMIVNIGTDNSHNKYDIDFSGKHPIYSGSHENLQIAASSDVTNLNIDFGNGMCILSESSDDSFHINTKHAEDFQYYIEDNTLYLKGMNNITSGIQLTDHNIINLEIPTNFCFENISITLAAGYLEANALTAANDISLKVGAGELIADSLTTETLSLEAGAGSVELKSAQVTDSCISLGMGNIVYDGLIRRDLTAECVTGNLELLLHDSYDVHNYSVDCTMGCVSINERDFGAFAYSSEISHDTDSDYTLNCGIGNINIQFQ